MPELRQVFGFFENHIQAILYDLRRMAQRVDITGGLHVVTDDPDDDKFIECAVVAGTLVNLSGDRRLLDLSECKGIRILSAVEFVACFARAEASA